jgi:ABC-type transporter MlaC component
MVKTRNIPAVGSRIAFFALLMITMLAAVLHIGGNEAQAASASLAWSAPTTNTDGTAVSNLAGYNLYVGNASRSYQQKINVGNSTGYNVANLSDGATYYFAVTAYNSTGVESAYSAEASKAFTAVTPTYTITATAYAGGTITPLNNTRVSTATSGTTVIKSVTVTQGASQGFSIAASTGYRIADVKVNGVSVGAVASYTFSNVTTNHSIAATFASTTTTASYTISATAGTGGSITPAGTSTVTSGGSKGYTIAPATGYRIADVKVNGVSVGAVASYTFTNVTANKTIAASFSVIPRLVYAANAGGAQYTDASAVVYRADSYFTGGSVANVAVAINNTTDDALYQTERWGASTYNIPLANGNYNLTLKFAENYWGAAGKRVFDVAVGGVTMISNLDVYAKVGKNTAYDVVLPVTVSNGTLNVRFINKIDNAKICGFKIYTR